jgi:hypothetical protein
MSVSQQRRPGRQKIEARFFAYSGVSATMRRSMRYRTHSQHLPKGRESARYLPERVQPSKDTDRKRD